MVALHVGLLSLCVLSGIIINSYGAPITCNAGTYSGGQPASVTCNFRTNISASQRSFNMARYSSREQKGAIGTDVLVCHWVHGSQNHDCIVTQGYRFDGKITNYVTVEIPNPTDTYSGLYMCFFVPPEGRDSHACDFLTKDDPSFVTGNGQTNDTTTPVPTPEDGNPKTIVAVIASFSSVALLMCLVGCVVVRLCRNSGGCRWATCLCRNREGGEPEETVTFIPQQDTEIQQRLKKYELSTTNLKKMMNILNQEMNKGLEESTRCHADVKMYPALCPKPDKTGFGDVLMVDFGSTCVNVLVVKFRQNHFGVHSQTIKIEPGVRKATGEQICDFIVSAIDRFVKENKLFAKTKSLPAVLIFHFPCHHKSIDKASLAKWTKEFRCEGIVDQDLNDLLQNAMQKRTNGDRKLKVLAIVNSAVNTLLSVLHQNPKCKICLTVGNGLNVCYLDTLKREEADEGKGGEGHETYEIYNTELGALGENGSLDYLLTDYDKELDAASSSPSSQVLEKMVSWTYIGEIVRLTLEDLRKEGLVFRDTPAWYSLSKPEGFTADHVAEVDRDTTENCQETAEQLKAVGVLNPSEEDIRTVQRICRLVIDRSASLAAASLATVINRLNQTDIVIAVDGVLNRTIPRFHDMMYIKTNELVKPELRDKFFLVSSFNGGCIGAVRMAAAKLFKKNATAADN